MQQNYTKCNQNRLFYGKNLVRIVSTVKLHVFYKQGHAPQLGWCMLKKKTNLATIYAYSMLKISLLLSSSLRLGSI